MKKIIGAASVVRRCIDDYNMIDDGETVAIGVSGGKDSLALLCIMADISRYHPKKFNIHAVSLGMGFPDMDMTPVARLCETLNIPFTQKDTNIAQIVFDERKEKNPCALCSKMRKGALCKLVKELGMKKIALAHHYDDAAETFLMSLLYESRIHCFQPVSYLDRSGVTQIRPMLYVKEEAIISLVSSLNIRVVENTCPMNGYSKREEVKRLLKSLGVDYPDIKQRIFRAMQELPINGW